MSSFLLAPVPLYGHVVPMSAVAAQLIGRGHRVTAAVGPPYAEIFRSVGCGVTEVAITSPSAERSPGLREARALRRRQRAERSRLAAQIAAEVTRSSTNVVVADSNAPWGADAARATRTRYASLYATYALNEEVLLADAERRLAPRTARFLRRTHLLRRHPAVRNPAARSSLVLVNSNPELQPAFGSFDQRYRFVGPLRSGDADRTANGGASLPWERIERGPTLYVSTGTFTTRGPEFFRTAAVAFAGTDWFVVLATALTDPAELGPLPDNVVARRYVPQAAVLEHSDVFLSHAGMNSALEALALGVPMVLMPSFWDQRSTARALVDIGAGVPLEPNATAADLRAAVLSVAADERVAATLRELAARTAAAGGPALAARALEKFAARGRPSRNP